MNRRWIPFIFGFVIAIALGWLGLPYVLYGTTEQPVRFSHAVHTGESVGMSCQDCHALQENGTFAGIPPLEQCKNCHSEVIGTTESERVFVEQYVKNDREVPWLVYSRQPDNVYFSHVYHVKTANLECETCHASHGTQDSLREYQYNRLTGYSRDIWGTSISGISMNTADGKKMSDCIDCHRAKQKVSSCLDCHK